MGRTKKSEPHAIIADCEKQIGELTARQHAIEAQLAAPQDGDLDAGSDGRYRLESELREIGLRLQRLELEKIEAQLEVAQATAAYYERERSAYLKEKQDAQQRLRDETKAQWGKRWRKIVATFRPVWYRQLQMKWHELFAKHRHAESHLRDLERRRRELLTPTTGRNDWAACPLSDAELDQRAQAMT